MNDVLPEDEAVWRHIRDTAERVARLFDYHRIETPLVEEVGVFTHTAGEESDIVAKEMTPAQIAEANRLAREWKPKGK